MADLAPTSRNEASGGIIRNPSIPPKNGKCLWNSLAKEIRDEILRYAYGRQPVRLNIKMKEDFDKYNKYEQIECRREGRQFKPIRCEVYINRFLVSKTWANEAAQALFSTTDIHFESRYATKFFPSTYLGVEFLSSIYLSVNDVARVATKLVAVCPRLRHVHVHMICFAFALLNSYPQTSESIYTSNWAVDQVQEMMWFREIRPLSGLKSASISHDGFAHYENRSDEEKTNITTNIKLVQSLFEQSATRALEAPPSLPPPRVSSRAPIPSTEENNDDEDDENLELRMSLHRFMQYRKEQQEQQTAISRDIERLQEIGDTTGQ